MRRLGKVARLMDHGLAVIWETKTRLTFPYYNKLPLVNEGDEVEFDLDKSESIVRDLVIVKKGK